ncbi:tripartite tricarboxylate transporter substrate binding protein [Ammoniphilus resinae]|uniref:Tripartite-type tricarboxylate transporter receptor subunit TctC n=1 Tax=Ammoniphilus resinae TaxID=861532 RepID=A0ABS4GNV9_9BACL|nr:tripartite tricarboxylate transporter substrate binding protein [Ammoniphilus resinae]MBP1931926.1 tripartite-type tricarboxylate transporter receptor subunit TctC [Ammoniphilus resinae]
MKKFTSMLFSSLLAVSLIATGCSQQPQPTATPSGNGENQQKETPVDKPVDYPKKPIQLVIPFAPGGDTDLNARVLAKHLEKELGQPVVVSNVTGAGGSVATQKVKDSKADGYTVLFHHNTMLLNNVLGVSPLSFKDFESAGIAMMDLTNTYTVSSKSKYHTLQDFIDEAKKRPNELNVASAIANFSQLTFLAFQKETGTEFNIIDVGGGNDQKTALLADRVDLIYGTYSLVKPHVDSGEFRVLGFMSEERNPELPDIPTFKEQGVNLVYDKFFFLSFPKDTPKEIIGKFSQAMEKVSNSKEYQDDLKKLYVTPKYMPPADAVTYLENVQKEYEKFKTDMEKPVEKVNP